MNEAQDQYNVYMRDGRRRIDAVLVYARNSISPNRDMFLQNLQKKGLELENETSSSNTFVKIHAPTAVLIKYALKFEIPIKFQQLYKLPEPEIHKCLPKTILNDPYPDPNHPVYRAASETISKDKPKDFTTSERSQIVFSMMHYTRHGSGDFEIGLPQLLHKKIFLTAYPLHDGNYKWPIHDDYVTLNDRQLLGKYWANFRVWNKQQPLNVVQKYFGNELGIYFAWLGFYNKMLILASVLGVICFGFGIIYINMFADDSLNETCELDINMCPVCKDCPPDKLSSYCSYLKYAFINDNYGSVIFAFAMSFWATFFVVFWKREYSTLGLRWYMTTDYNEKLRPQFQELANHIRIHEYTGEIEQYIPLCSRICSTGFSIVVVIFMVFMVLATTFCIILVECILRMYLIEKLYITCMSSVTTLIIMLIFRQVYGKIAVWLTNIEVPRTEFEYDKSLMLKMVIFSFVNHYGKLIYIAFFKGKFFTYPGDEKMRNRKFPMAAEICDPTGCVFEIFMLMVTMCLLKPIIVAIIEFILPIIMVWINKIKISETSSIKEASTTIWGLDYDLNEIDRYTIMKEFEQMVVQFGFVTLLVPAFPLAPLCALIKNIIELRIDALKYNKYFRRPIPRTRLSICLWFEILEAMTRVAVVTNALFITFTSNFIPKLVYYFEHKSDLTGFIQFTLSEYKIVDDYFTIANITTCYYSGYRYPPGHADEYSLSNLYYYILVSRFAFALLFIIFVLGFTSIIAYTIPDIPRSIQDQMAYISRLEREVA